jgi:cytidyltransferase-like protein
MEPVEVYPYELKLSELYPNGQNSQLPIKIYTDGVFDCFHYGHARLFEKVKKMLPYVHLTVGVCLDEDITREKAPPIMDLKQRMESVRHCKWVDEVVPAPWLPTCEFLDSINVHYLAHDPEPYPYKDMADAYGEIKEAGRFISTTRTEGISTTDMIVKIIENYDTYVERSIKKKVPLSSLNLSTTHYLKYKLQEIEKSISSKLRDLATEVYESDPSKKLIKEYLDSHK